MATVSRSHVVGTRLATRGDGRVGVEALARRAGTHPDVVRRLVALGLIAPSGGTSAAPRFRPSDGARLARALRLRQDLGLNYAGAVLACELLARIDELEAQLRTGKVSRREQEVTTWIRTG